MADQKIEPPTEVDVDAIARALIHAEHVVHEALGRKLDGSRGDLRLLQELLDSGTVEREATYRLQALGLAFGRVFLTKNPGYDWWMVEDEYGRDPAIRYQRSALLAYPRTMLSKRIEDGEPVDCEPALNVDQGRAPNRDQLLTAQVLDPTRKTAFLRLVMVRRRFRAQLVNLRRPFTH